MKNSISKTERFTNNAPFHYKQTDKQPKKPKQSFKEITEGETLSDAILITHENDYIRHCMLQENGEKRLISEMKDPQVNTSTKANQASTSQLLQ